MKRNVVFARLHDIAVVHPKVGNLDRSLPPNSKTYPNLKMWLEDGVLEIEIAGVSSGVPLSNVQYMQFGAPDAPVANQAIKPTSIMKNAK